MVWIWSVLGWGLALLGVGVVVWALFWGRAGSQKRRRWGGVAVGVGLMVAAHAAVSVPAVRARGLVGAAPSVVLVGVMAAASDRAGPPDSGGAWRDAVLAELRIRAWGVGHPGAVDGWLSRRLVFVLAKALPADLVTDQGTTRGRMFHSVVNGAMFRDRAYGFERAWSESVVWVGAEDRVVSPGSPVWAEVRVRRLVAGRYRVEVGEGQGAVWFEAYSRDWGETGPNPGPGMTEAQRREAERGDQIVAMGSGLFGVRSERGMRAVVARFGDAASAAGRGMVEQPVRVLARTGPVGGDGPWELESEPGLGLVYTVASEAGPERVVGAEADALRRVVEQTLRVETYWVTEQVDGERTFAINVLVADMPALTRSVTIGGPMEVGAWREVAGERVWVGLGSVGPGWFRVMPVPAGTEGGDWFFMADELLLPWPQVLMETVRWFGGGNVLPDFAGTEPVVLRIGLGGRDEAWADLSDGGGTERVLDAEVEIDTGTTVGEVMRVRSQRKRGTLRP